MSTRSSPAKRSLALAVFSAFIGACATAQAPTPPPTETVEEAAIASPAPEAPARDTVKPVAPTAPALPSLADLRRAEFENPRDPAVKLKLGQRLWCENARGAAVEKWLWVMQFAPASPEAMAARVMMRSVYKKQNPLTSVDPAVVCLTKT